MANGKNVGTAFSLFFLLLDLRPSPFALAQGMELRPISEADFQCRGRAGRIVSYEGKEYADCAGGHGPAGGVREDLLRLLNGLQSRVGRRVVVTSGYRCEAHNLYSWAFV